MVFIDLGISLTLLSPTQKISKTLSVSIHSKAYFSSYLEDFQSILSPVVEIIALDSKAESSLVLLELLCDTESYKKLDLTSKEIVFKRIVQGSDESEDIHANLVSRMVGKFVIARYASTIVPLYVIFL